MEMVIKSRKAQQEFSFWMPAEGGYIRLQSPGKPGTLGAQICKGGGTMGSTLSATPDTFEVVCRKWYRQHVNKNY